ncbi:copper resistance system multicopper oxidase [Opitutus terrae]|uniref:Copper-resistance protein, CopA family n=1 Tax=Opitutus terrae (strain DSM 11246 / JCM 15787 / PB90-1) TaxID=452637 RepID=B1ZRL6_OPITP|nr:copper resistance system multicopper oxidase [Opitutus terrae]ACB77666.1 copper-resistance protein, CopA family [Opitutus terrae PB90-1]
MPEQPSLYPFSRVPRWAEHSRRDFLTAAGKLALCAALARIAPGWAQAPHEGHRPRSTAPADANGAVKVLDLSISEVPLPIGERIGHVVAVNGSLPAPALRFREGDELELRVSNQLDEQASIHWHGLLVPAPMDGVPGVSFKGIEAGETFVYRFPVKQYGTYWYHSHSAMHEQLGQYGPIIIDPIKPEPFAYDREHVVVLSDWTFTHPHVLFAKLKKRSNFSNMQRRTAVDFFNDAARKGWDEAWEDWSSWARMRMDPTDIADLTGSHFTYLLNGRTAVDAWTGIVRAGERVRLRFINAAATTHYDVRIPGLKMTVVQADGQHVRPVEVEEFRMGAAETYDVLVTLPDERPCTIFAETTDRSGYALGTLAPREGLRGPVPERRKRPVRTMADMGMGGHDMSGNAQGTNTRGTPSGSSEHSGGHGAMDGGAAAHHSAQDSGAMDHGPKTSSHAAADNGADHAGHGAAVAPNAQAAHRGYDTGDHDSAATNEAAATNDPHSAGHGDMEMPENRFGPGNAMMAMSPVSRAHEPGLGLGEDGWRVLVYRDLVALDHRAMPEPTREIVMHVTGNMERFVWGFDGKKFSEAEPVRLRFGERVRITFINDTMMEHPLHLHGMFMELENGAGGLPPLKHTVTVKPAEKMSVLVTADAPGHWAFHCHLQYHMEAGMFRVFEVA